MNADKVRRVKQKRGQTAKMLTQVHRLFVSGMDDRALALATALVNSFGGLDRFIRCTRDWINEPDAPVSFRYKVMLTTQHMLRVAAERMDDDERRLAEAREGIIAGMSDEQLEAERERLAVKFLRSLGYRVERPECDPAPASGGFA